MKQFIFALLAVVVAPGTIWAGGHHHSHHGMMHGSSLMSAPVISGPVMGGPVAGGHMMMAAVGPVVAPPPGTVGQTYSRVSHPIPEDEHPRTAMLAVRDQEPVEYMRAKRMGGFRMKNGIWLFETNRPLFPGQEHVIRVEARKDKADIQPYKVKFVRLIPGRIVYLDF